VIADGVACTVQGGSTSVIRHNKINMLGGHKCSASVLTSSRFIYVGIPQVNYGVGMINVVGNAIRGSNSSADSRFTSNLSLFTRHWMF